ncbi:kinase [Lysobacter sp. TY2-98]|uniref:kinase n=1 Tax=Lysobacter sp. TY2-98 TaxID=2290922 RepID=UPI000E1FF7B2|nr:kinase [Lysobacter sp. TY2-98]AXK71375.1 kinase [Lysobacter sp. TY2-98]
MPEALHVHGPDPAFVVRVLDVAIVAGRIFAIGGAQGCGKSTLAARMVGLARERGVRAITLSLDDVYLDRPQRLALARDVHPLLATRGPPGTHDIALMSDVLDALRDGRRARLPRFDKLTDRRLPERDWPRVDRCDLTIVEGWCLDIPAESPDALVTPMNTVERDEDIDGTWRRYCNDALARDYPALWSRLPHLLYLEPPSFEVVPAWRWEQEQAARASRPTAPGMSRADIDRFVQLFERVTRRGMATLPAIARHVVHLDGMRTPHPDDMARLAPTIGG